ncbi:MAG: cytochrome C oxidase subunit IV family protein [Flavobacteriaceae bacterium]
MKAKKLIVVLVALMVLTPISALAANGLLGASQYVIIVASCLKFLLVGFYFMDVADAHPTWKFLLTGFTLLFFGLVVLFLPVL